MQMIFAYHEEHIAPTKSNAKWVIQKDRDHNYTTCQEIYSARPPQATHPFSEQDRRISAFLKWFFPPQEIKITPIQRGHNFVKNYLTETAEKKYVMRLLSLSAPEDQIQKELYMMQEAAALGIGPKVIAISDRVVLMEFIDGKTLTPQVARLHAKEAGATLCKAHEIPKNPSVGKTTYLGEAEGRYQFIKERAAFPEAEQAIEIIRRDSSKLSPLRSNIHGDLHPHNLFWTGDGLKLIDWEWIMWDHPYLDLARFAMSLALDQDAESDLLEGYFGTSPTVAEKQQYDLAKRLNFANMATICLKLAVAIQEQEPETPIDPTAPFEEWSSYMEVFAEANERMPLQFFYDAGRSAYHMMLKCESTLSSFDAEYCFYK